MILHSNRTTIDQEKEMDTQDSDEWDVRHRQIEHAWKGESSTSPAFP